MRVYIQWALADPGDWEAHDLVTTGDVRRLPARAAPTSPTQPLDGTRGWVNGINCQGIVFDAYDHYAIEPVTINGEKGLRITGWQDSDDFPPGTRQAVEWTLLEPAPDPALGGIVNTRQAVRAWDESGTWNFPNVLPWSDFAPPPTNMTRHGKWMPDTAFRASVQARSRHGWEDWT